MRMLTNEEINFVAGGMDEYDDSGNGNGGGGNGGDVVVTAPGGGGFGSGATFTNPGSGGDGGGATPGGGDNAAGGADPYAHREEHVTPGGHHYIVNGDLHLSDKQIAMINKIVDYGFSHGYGTQAMDVAVRQAFYESSFGKIVDNPTNSSVKGLYQYDANTWHDLGHDGMDRSSDSDQIKAMYQDIDKYWNRWESGASQQVPGNYTFEKYMEVKHHLGNNSTDWNNSVVNDYTNKSNNLGFDAQ